MTDDIASAARRIMGIAETRAANWRSQIYEADIEAIASAYLQAVEILQGFLGCPEIADCAPEDKDPETDALERRARRLITGEQSHG